MNSRDSKRPEAATPSAAQKTHNRLEDNKPRPLCQQTFTVIDNIEKKITCYGVTDMTADLFAQARAAITPTLIAENVRAADPGARLSGDEWTLLCPFHGEESPSCNVNAQNGLFHCKACGAHGDQIAYIAHVRHLTPLEAAQWIKDHGNGHSPAVQIPAKAKPPMKPATDTEVKDFHDRLSREPGFHSLAPYRAADGKALFCIARHEPKQIRPWYLTIAGNWIQGQPLENGRPLLWLQKLLENPGAAVLVVEGEKTAAAAREHLRAIGRDDILATTWAGGANAWRKTDFTPLHGRTVYLYPDADKAGVDAMNKISRLLEGKATMYAVTPREDAEPGEDAADIDAETFKTLLDAAVPWEAPREEEVQATQERPIPNTDEPQEKKRGPKASKIVTEALSSFNIGKCAGRPYFLNGAQAFEIGSQQYRDFISRYSYSNLNMALSETALREISAIHRGQALFEGDELPVGVRVMAYSDKCYLDLCDKGETVIEIGADGWKPIERPPVYFFRPPHLKPLPMPLHDGEIELLKTVLSFSDCESFILIRAALLFYLHGRPGDRGTFPICRLCGPSGSAKSTRAKLIKYMIDPGIPEGRTLTKEPRDLYISAKNQYCLVFDNVSRMDGELQDAICNIASRGGYGRKKNYTDDDEAVFEDCRPIIINGITFKVQQDLQGRMINVDLSQIQAIDRRTETAVWKEADRHRPSILGGLLDALSATLKEIQKKKEITGFELPRLADFAEFTIHMERGNGWPEGEAIRALRDNYSVALTALAEDNPLTDVMIKFITGKLSRSFTGTAEELLKELNDYVKTHAIEKTKSWPDSASKLGNFITRNIDVLLNKGLSVKKDRTKTGRILKMWAGEAKSEENDDDIPF